MANVSRKLCALVALGLPVAATSEAPTAPIRLRTSGTVSFSHPGFFAFVSPARCDERGNVYFVVVPALKAGDVEKARTECRAPSPHEVLGVTADGKTTLFDPASVPAFAGADDISTLATALDPGGNLFALVWVRRRATGSQHLVSVDKNGRYRSDREIPEHEMSAQWMEVFGSGAFLLRGVPQEPTRPQAEILSKDGSLRDVTGWPDASWSPSSSSRPMARAGDGRIYFVSEDGHSVHVVDPSGATEWAFDLAPMPPGQRLMDLKAGGERLAAIYFENRPDGKGRSWIAVYDAARGERLATYGPASGWPVCYAFDGGQDHFTVWRGNYLDTVSPEESAGSR